MAIATALSTAMRWTILYLPKLAPPTKFYDLTERKKKIILQQLNISMSWNRHLLFDCVSSQILLRDSQGYYAVR